MGIFFDKKGEGIRPTKIAKLSLIIVLVSMASALVGTIWAVYSYGFFHTESNVGYFSSLLTIISVLAYLFLIPLLEKVSKTKIFLYSLFLFALVYLSFAINNNLIIFIIIAAVMSVLFSLRINAFGIILKENSEEKNLSTNEGVRFTFTNFAWVFGPLIAGYLAEKYGFNLIFIVTSLLIFLTFILFACSKIRDKPIIQKNQINSSKHLIKNIIEFFKDKHRLRCYIIGGGPSLWWGMIYLFIPLEIIKHGLEKIWIGYFLFAVAVPLILCEYKFSKLAGRIGFKKMFVIGFAVTGIFSIACFFTSNMYLIMALLILASFGMAMLEPTTEAYFFDLTPDKDEHRFYGPYNTTLDVNTFISKILTSTLLLVLPFKFVYILFGVLMFILVLFSLKIKDIIEYKKSKKHLKITHHIKN